MFLLCIASEERSKEISNIADLCVAELHINNNNNNQYSCCGKVFIFNEDIKQEVIDYTLKETNIYWTVHHTNNQIGCMLISTFINTMDISTNVTWFKFCLY